MNLLALDTSTDRIILGVSVAGEMLDRSKATDRSHSRDILPLIESTLSEAGITLHQLDAIVMGQGPGSFTGLRIAVGVTQGLAWGLGLPVAPVSSMACLAQQFSNSSDKTDNSTSKKTGVIIALKARLQEVYYGTYRFEESIAQPLPVNPMSGGAARAEGVFDVTEVASLQAPPSNQEGSDQCSEECSEQWPTQWIAAGDGWQFKDELQKATGVIPLATHLDATLRLADLMTLGRAAVETGATVPAEKAQPVYLRETVAEKQKDKKQKQQGGEHGKVQAAP